MITSMRGFDLSAKNFSLSFRSFHFLQLHAISVHKALVPIEEHVLLKNGHLDCFDNNLYFLFVKLAIVNNKLKDRIYYNGTMVGSADCCSHESHETLP